jgi:hypothetical protein
VDVLNYTPGRYELSDPREKSSQPYKPMAAALPWLLPDAWHLISITAGVERRCKLDALQGFFAHDHSLQFCFANNDSTGIYKDLNASCMFGLCWVKLLP